MRMICDFARCCSSLFCTARSIARSLSSVKKSVILLRPTSHSSSKLHIAYIHIICTHPNPLDALTEGVPLFRDPARQSSCEVGSLLPMRVNTYIIHSYLVFTGCGWFYVVCMHTCIGSTRGIISYPVLSRVVHHTKPTFLFCFNWPPSGFSVLLYVTCRQPPTTLNYCCTIV